MWVKRPPAGVMPRTLSTPVYTTGFKPTTARIIIIGCVVRKFGEEVCQLRCRPRHLIAIQNFEVRPQICFLYQHCTNMNSQTLTSLRRGSDYQRGNVGDCLEA
ncbi:hypothetical protein AVEN_161264-1 [Araneus ventricosus]|uniref:Uncharacterized protein n=1 Tax=Araneus ventricosus TaxID=182803 RepID=A0A4Y2KAS7_ARAVE|nr:hypothetical protein AVEN_161264-1 [Araneus ventricosus]